MVLKVISKTNWQYWLNNIDSISSVVSFGRFVRKRILLGSSGTTTAGWTAAGMTVEQSMSKKLKEGFQKYPPSKFLINFQSLGSI